MKKIILLIICILFLTGCGSEKNPNPIVTMEIEDYGIIKIELYPNMAPNTVANFVNLIESGFYDGNSFHRLVPDFILQGGDPTGTGSGGPGYTIKGEFRANKFYKNTLSHTTGVISMARRSDSYDSAGSQFFIVLDDSEMVKQSLDLMYAGFGKVIDGIDIIKEIEQNEEIEDTKTGKLKENIIISKVTVDTFGATYKVEKIR